MKKFFSWGLFPPHYDYRVAELSSRVLPVPWPENGNLLPVGMGRSYGDVCLNNHNTILITRSLRFFLNFDADTGILRCESGVTLGDILEFFVPHGWFLPVTPGTKYVSVGGAIANDVHGKNHHVKGTFGHYVKRFALARSDGTVVECSPLQNEELFNATIGGIGLTGVLLWADIELVKVAGPWIVSDSIPFSRYEEFFPLSQESEERFEFVVAWIDCLARGENMGRGVLFRGNYSPERGAAVKRSSGIKVNVPFLAPSWLLSPVSVKAFNSVYAFVHSKRRLSQRTHFDPFFYPLDSIGSWNRLYGKRGFLQFQCVASRDAMRSILGELSCSGCGSFLAVLKEFGEIGSPGLISFPRKGVTLALDLPIKSEATFKLLKRLEAMVVEDRGAIYPAKDAIMEPESFKNFYPRWADVERLRDPLISSSFWRRVTQ